MKGRYVFILAVAAAFAAVLFSAVNAISCRKNGVYKPLTPEDQAACRMCDFYYCLWYPQLNVWFVYPQNCTRPPGVNMTWNYTFSDTTKRCVLNGTTLLI
ncbi:hypothetical protein Ocin01_13671 [Orchesella cincta]|uniref:Uncharacterized protein n=1 Tax=Orchesella cincta TaxID=48709 RepID=A0A1D2MJB0_ORCCI|nr:hypothetical protein Ocin01_13671 [Orchesella cincta]